MENQTFYRNFKNSNQHPRILIQGPSQPDVRCTPIHFRDCRQRLRPFHPPLTGRTLDAAGRAPPADISTTRAAGLQQEHKRRRPPFRLEPAPSIALQSRCPPFSLQRRRRPIPLQRRRHG